MSMLDSHVEALAFNYVSFGFFTVVNNLWTLVALVTAAVSFWKIRAAAASTAAMMSCINSDDVQHAHAHAQQSCYDEKPNGCETQVSESEEDPSCTSRTEVVALQTETSSSSPLVVTDGSTKGKFALYYYEDACCMESEEEAAAAEEAEECEDCGEGDGEWWVRKGGMEWYSYQDLSLINGNVVRLWDASCIRRGFSPSRAVF